MIVSGSSRRSPPSPTRRGPRSWSIQPLGVGSTASWQPLDGRHTGQQAATGPVRSGASLLMVAPANTPAASAGGWGVPSPAPSDPHLVRHAALLVGRFLLGFAMAAPAITSDTGWPESVVAGALALGLLVAGIAAPPVATALARRDPRRVLTGGSLLGIIGMLGFAAAPNPLCSTSSGW